MQDIGQDQFLMLLLMVDAEFNQRPNRPISRALGSSEQIAHRRIDKGSVGKNLGQARPRQQPALRPRMAGANSFIVRVEEEAPPLIIDPIPGEERNEQKGFKEPGGVGKMPLRRARVRHRLQRLILRIESRGDGLRPQPGGAERLVQGPLAPNSSLCRRAR